ncbi:MAG: hypothetical protein J3Q66DRAFT_397689 [Benniella sp.]|nr:MAG: hypothetical protein J3Q66DRAFT_397689 [Benniella sp.]
MNYNFLTTILDTPDKGKGMFATKSIERGTLILSETPLLYIGDSTPVMNRLAVSSLNSGERGLFHSLYNAFSKESADKDGGIIQTNAIPLKPGAQEYAVYRNISRINHSCVPNASHTWDPKSKKGSIYAIKDIPAGKEILLNYIELRTMLADRERVLQHLFQFTCHCELCTAQSKEN